MSGVVLANASLDIAFHDTIGFFGYSVFYITILTPIFKVSEKRGKGIYDTYGLINEVNNNEYIKMFWVGLMDGCGSIQVNHWRKLSLQYRLVIKLYNLTSNYKMLVEIAKVIGGSVKITGKNKDVIWVVNKKEDILNIIKIFEYYPLLTSRKICQLNFLKKCILKNSIDWYLNNRNNKYDNQLSIIKSNTSGLDKNVLNIPSHFPGWLSGFIEAQGYFSINNKNHLLFFIGQSDDLYLLHLIAKYLKITGEPLNPYGNFFSLEIYYNKTLDLIINHINKNPLLGEKSECFNKWVNHSK